MLWDKSSVLYLIQLRSKHINITLSELFLNVDEDCIKWLAINANT
jgi:hypothetical protein